MSSHIESADSFEGTAKKYGAQVKASARRLAARCPANVEVDDLTQVGMIALWKATQTFDRTLSSITSSQDDAFSAYGMQKVRGAMLDELRSMDTLSRRDRALAKQLRRTIERALGHDLDLKRLPTHLVAQAAQDAEITDEEAHRILLHSTGASSLEPGGSSADEHDGLINANSIPSTGHDVVENSADAAIWMHRLPALAQKLDEREQAVLMNWLHEHHNQSDLGKDFNITESRICQIKKKILDQLPRYAAALVRDQANASGSYVPNYTVDRQKLRKEQPAPATGLEWMNELLSSHQIDGAVTIEDVGASHLRLGAFTSNDASMDVSPGTLWG